MHKYRYLTLIILFGLFNNKVISQNSIYDENFVLELASGKEIKLNNFKNKKLLIVNVASKCGFTGQYEGLQKLSKIYPEKKFAVIGFPFSVLIFTPSLYPATKACCGDALITVVE